MRSISWYAEDFKKLFMYFSWYFFRRIKKNERMILKNLKNCTVLSSQIGIDMKTIKANRFS